MGDDTAAYLSSGAVSIHHLRSEVQRSEAGRNGMLDAGCWRL